MIFATPCKAKILSGTINTSLSFAKQSAYHELCWLQFPVSFYFHLIVISPVLQNHHINSSMQFSKTPLPSFYWYPQSYLQQAILVYVYIPSLLSPRSALIISAMCSTFHCHRTMYILVSLPFNILVSDSLLFCVVRSTETAELPQLFHHIRRWRLAYNRQRSTHFTIHFLHISHMNWYLVWWRVESGDHLSISFAYPRLITNNSFRYIVVDSSFICHFRLLYLSATIAILSLAVVQSCGSHTRAELVGGKSRCGQASCETPQALISSTISYQRDTNKPSAS